MKNGYGLDPNGELVIDYREVAMMVRNGDKLMIILKGNSTSTSFPWDSSGRNILKAFTDWVKSPEN